MTGGLSRDGEPGLLMLLSTIAGLVDVIGFLQLGHVFTAHITGNLVLLLADAVGAGSPSLAQLLSIPVFAVAVAAAYLIARRSGPSRGRGELLVAQALLLFLALTLALQPRGHPRSPLLLTAMAAVAAMAFQNAFIRLSLHASWTTSVTTGNVATAILALVGLLRPVPWTREKSLRELRATVPLILGFTTGCLIGATCASRLGSWAWSIPAALSVVAVATGTRAPERRHSGRSPLQRTEM
jgi:uncharacterized membrane protein YoaK (UPF0700 family)